jgi:hypothetical protein
VVLALVAALAACRDAATNYWLEVDPAHAPWILQPDVRFALAAQRQTLLRPDDQPVTEIAAIAEKSRQSLARWPLDPIAVRQIALARMWLGQPGGEVLLSASQRLSHRDIGTQIALFNLAAAKSDYAKAVDHLDLALVQYPASANDLLIHLVPLLERPAFIRSLSNYRQQAWVRQLMSAAVDSSADPLVVARSMHMLAVRPDRSDPQLAARLIAKLLRAGHLPEAYQVVELAGGPAAGAFAGLGFSAATVDPHFTPLAWDLETGDVAQTTFIGTDGIEAEMNPGNATLLVQRATGFAAGHYRFIQPPARLATPGLAALEWQLGCATPNGPARPAWRGTFGNSTRSANSVTLEIPQGCPIQYWQLWARTDDTQLPVRFTVPPPELEATSSSARHQAPGSPPGVAE